MQNIDNYIVFSDRPDVKGHYLGQEGFVQTTTLDQARQYLTAKRQGKNDAAQTKLYRLVEVE